jgi:hypothetical protein
MQGIYIYIPETNYVPREYSVAAILLFLFMVLRLLSMLLSSVTTPGLLLWIFRSVIMDLSYCSLKTGFL